MILTYILILVLLWPYYLEGPLFKPKDFTLDLSLKSKSRYGSSEASEVSD